MNTKLTLRLDDSLIGEAKQYAKRQGKSISQIVADYFRAIRRKSSAEKKKPLGPITKKLYGSLKEASVSKKDYRRYMERKYR
jgi:hypothetical protein